MLTENDFNLLRFKLAHLLKVKQSKITKIDVLKDNSIVVFCPLSKSGVLFKNVKEINDEYEKFCGDVVVPKNFLLNPNEINTGLVSSTCKSGVQNKKGVIL